MDLIELAEQCEMAQGPDRNLDADILQTLADDRWEKLIREVQARGGCGCPDDMAVEEARKLVGYRYPFTASLDAAKTLFAPGTLWAIGSMEDGPFARLCWPQRDGSYLGGYVEATGATAELAACTAALRAHAAYSPTPEL